MSCLGSCVGVSVSSMRHLGSQVDNSNFKICGTWWLAQSSLSPLLCESSSPKVRYNCQQNYVWSDHRNQNHSRVTNVQNNCVICWVSQFHLRHGQKTVFWHEHVLVKKRFLPEPLRSSCLLSNQNMLCIFSLVLAGGLVGNEDYPGLFLPRLQFAPVEPLSSAAIALFSSLGTHRWRQYPGNQKLNAKTPFHALLIHLARHAHHSKPSPGKLLVCAAATGPKKVTNLRIVANSSAVLQIVRYIYLEPIWPLFLKVNPPKHRLVQSKQGSFGF